MNREIKFRVWDKEYNKYFIPTYEAYKGKLIDLSITLSGQILKRTLEYPAELIHEKFTIEQFTGLKDKNGTEIYEGDILKSRDSKFDEDDGMYSDLLIVEDYNAFIFTVLFSEENSGLNGYTQKDIEIIGNIHENENLLK